MRKSGWAVAAAGVSSLVLLLTACGGSSSSSSAAGTSSTTPATGGQPSGGVSRPAPGTQVLIVERSKAGWVLAEASGFVVYTYGGDTKGGSPTCTGSCAALWPAVTGLPQAGPADTLPGTLGTVTMANGAKQITYNGYPLYTLKGAGALSTKGNGMEGKWHVIKLSAKDVTASF
jgi:predicted lipoprotein with Yx(FWY)xxD motif